jgi:Kv channel-interacting protein
MFSNSDFREFLIGMSASAEGDLREKLKTAFRIYDIDKNGLVDKKEMEQIITAIYELRGEDSRKGDNAPAEIVKRIMSRLDKNNDGMIIYFHTFGFNLDLF